jgi:hypothetical protein
VVGSTSSLSIFLCYGASSGLSVVQGGGSNENYSLGCEKGSEQRGEKSLMAWRGNGNGGGAVEASEATEDW